MNDFSIGIEYRRIKESEQGSLNLPQKIAESKGIKIIIYVDEFQNLATLKDYSALEGNMRSV